MRNLPSAAGLPPVPISPTKKVEEPITPPVSDPISEPEAEPQPTSEEDKTKERKSVFDLKDKDDNALLVWEISTPSLFQYIYICSPELLAHVYLYR